MRVFVYGTLRQGQANETFLSGASLLGPHRTAPCFRMLDLGPYPGVVSGGTTAIHGEVYAIDGQVLALLDRLEDYPTSYDRQRIPTPWGPAFIYLYRRPVPKARLVPSGDWLDCPNASP